MSRLTIFLGRLMGLFSLVIVLAMLIKPLGFVETAAAFLHDPPALMIVGMLALAAGLAIVLAHNRWSGGVLTVVVTLLGWILLIRGVLILCLPWRALVRLYGRLGFYQHFRVSVVIALLIGLYLTYASFSASMPPEG